MNNCVDQGTITGQDVIGNMYFMLTKTKKHKGKSIVFKTKLFTAKLLALALVLALCTASADIDYHHLVWDACPSD